MVRSLAAAFACLLVATCIQSGVAQASSTRRASSPVHPAQRHVRHQRRRRVTRRCTRWVRVGAKHRRVKRTVRCSASRAKVKTRSRSKLRAGRKARTKAKAKRARRAAGRGFKAHAAGVERTWSAAQAHIETWAYDDCGNGGAGAGASVVRAWVTFAEANCGPAGDAKTLSDCHAGSAVFCDVIQYLDTNWIYPDGSPPWQPFSSAASESWYQHTPGSSSTRVLSTGSGGGYLINQANPAVRSFFTGYVRSHYDASDGLMMDDQSTNLNTELYYSSCGCHTTEEVSSTPALEAAHRAMSAAMTHSDGQPFLQIDNSLPANPYLPQGLGLVNRSHGVVGLVSEGAPEYDGHLTPFYSTLLDEIAYVGDRSSGFVVPLSYAPAGASYEGESRRVQEATMLLGYSPGHLVDWANLETGSGDLAVWPEEGIYPTDPVESMGVPGGSGCLGGTGVVCSRGGHNDLEVAPGVYRREFGDCYEQGASFGPCAAIVNTTSGPVTVRAEWLSLGLTHEITFSGGDVQSGGTVNVTGAAFTPGTTTVAGHGALLLSR